MPFRKPNISIQRIMKSERGALHLLPLMSLIVIAAVAAAFFSSRRERSFEDLTRIAPDVEELKRKATAADPSSVVTSLSRSAKDLKKKNPFNSPEPVYQRDFPYPYK